LHTSTSTLINKPVAVVGQLFDDLAVDFIAQNAMLERRIENLIDETSTLRLVFQVFQDSVETVACLLGYGFVPKERAEQGLVNWVFGVAPQVIWAFGKRERQSLTFGNSSGTGKHHQSVQ
jgi:hypothetical protein